MASGAGVAFSIQATGFALGYLMQLLLARWLGPTGFGVYAYALSWSAGLSVIAGFGLPTLVLRFVPQYAGVGDHARLRGLTSWAIGLTLAASALTCIALMGIVGLGGAFHWRQVELSASVIGWIWLLVPLSAAAALQTQLSRAAAKVFMAFGPPFLIRPAIVLVLCAALHRWGSLSAGTALLTTSIALVAVVLCQGIDFHIWRERLSARVASIRTKYEIREWLQVAWPLLALNAFQALIAQIDVICLGALRGPGDVGIYSVAARTAGLISMAINAVNLVIAVPIAALGVTPGRRELQRVVTTGARLIFAPTLLSCLALIIFAGPALSLFGPLYGAGTNILRLLAISQLINACAGPVALVACLTGLHKIAARVCGYTAVVAVVLNVVFVRSIGPLGSASATTIVTLLWNGWLYLEVLKRLGVHSSIYRPRSNGYVNSEDCNIHSAGTRE